MTHNLLYLKIKQMEYYRNKLIRYNMNDFKKVFIYEMTPVFTEMNNSFTIKFLNILFNILFQKKYFELF